MPFCPTCGSIVYQGMCRKCDSLELEMTKDDLNQRIRELNAATRQRNKSAKVKALQRLVDSLPADKKAALQTAYDNRDGEAARKILKEHLDSGVVF